MRASLSLTITLRLSASLCIRLMRTCDGVNYTPTCFGDPSSISGQKGKLLRISGLGGEKAISSIR